MHMIFDPQDFEAGQLNMFHSQKWGMEEVREVQSYGQRTGSQYVYV